MDTSVFSTVFPIGPDAKKIQPMPKQYNHFQRRCDDQFACTSLENLVGHF